MKIPKLTIGQAVSLYWVDCKSQLGWVYDPNLPRVPGRIRSLGFVVQQNKEVISITTSLDSRGAAIDDLSIPLGCLKEVVILPDEWHLKKKVAA